MGGIRGISENFSNYFKDDHINNFLGFTKVKINQIDAIALFDSGATINSISLSLFKRIIQTIKIKNCDFNSKNTIITISGNKIEPFTKIKLRIQIKGFSWKKLFVVIDGLPVPCILSYSFMKQIKIEIIPSKDQFYFEFNKKKYYSFLPHYNFLINNFKNLNATVINNKDLNTNENYDKDLHKLIAHFQKKISECFNYRIRQNHNNENKFGNNIKQDCSFACLSS